MSDISVSVVGVTNVSAVVANNASVSVSAGSTAGSVLVSDGPGFSAGGLTHLMVEAGANITVTTAQGSFMVSGRDIPVLSVAGRTGNVVLTASDVGGITSVANVTKINGRTGAVTLVSTDVSAASAVHTHVAASITDLTSVANVVSVNGRTGPVSLVSTDVSAASAVHTHVAASITDLTSVANVTQVNGRTGSVSLVSTDVSAASAVHTHVAASITDLASVANVVSVNGITGLPTIVAGDNVTVTTAGSSITISAAAAVASTAGGSVTSVNGKVGTVTLTVTDLTAASATHGHNYVTALNDRTGALSIVGGSNVTVTTGTSSVVISASSTPGPAGSFGDPQTISQRTASCALQLSDVGTLLTAYATAGSIVFTVPPTAAVSWVAGSHIDLARTGDALVQVTGAYGVDVLATPSPSLRDRGSGATLVCLAANSWLLVGDLS